MIMPGPDLLKRFLDSTVMDYEKWHDGTGYVPRGVGRARRFR